MVSVVSHVGCTRNIERFSMKRDKTERETSRKPLSVLLQERLVLRAEAASTVADTAAKSLQLGYHEFGVSSALAERQ
jgi:hypothetical protein